MMLNQKKFEKKVETADEEEDVWSMSKTLQCAHKGLCHRRSLCTQCPYYSSYGWSPASLKVKSRYLERLLKEDIKKKKRNKSPIPRPQTMAEKKLDKRMRNVLGKGI